MARAISVLRLTSALALLRISVAVGDFNEDGKQDIADRQLTTQTPFRFCSAIGTGNFTAASNLSAGSGPYSVAVGDFNGDGKQDLAVVN